MKKQCLIVFVVGLFAVGAAADGVFDYWSLTNHEARIKLQEMRGVQTPIPLPSRQFVDNLFAQATNSYEMARQVSYIMDVIGVSVRQFPDAYNQQEVETYAFSCLTNAVSMPDSLYWTWFRGGVRMKGRVIRTVFLSMPVVATNRNAICYLADYAGSIPVITIDKQVRYQEFQRAKSADDAREDKRGYRGETGPALEAHFAKWRRLDIEAPRWRDVRELYLRDFSSIAVGWKGAFSLEDFATIKSNFIERAHLTPEEVESVFGR